MLTGYLATFPNDVLFDSGIVRIASTNWGVTKGAPSFTPGRTIVNSDFDGKTVPLKLLDRILHGEPTVEFTALEFGPTTQIAKLEPGSASADTGVTPNTKTTITPLPGNQFLVAGSYLVDFRLIFERGIVAGVGIKKYAALYMPSAIVVEWGPLQGANKDNPTYKVKVAGRGDPAGDLSAAAYKIELLESLP